MGFVVCWCLLLCGCYSMHLGGLGCYRIVMAGLRFGELRCVIRFGVTCSLVCAVRLCVVDVVVAFVVLLVYIVCVSCGGCVSSLLVGRVLECCCWVLSSSAGLLLGLLLLGLLILGYC